MSDVKHTPSVGGTFKYSMKTPTISMKVDGRIRSPEHSAVVMAALDGQLVDDIAVLSLARSMLEALDHIGGLSRYLRQGGPDAMDLQGLSDALEEAVDMSNDLVRRASGEQP